MTVSSMASSGRDKKEGFGGAVGNHLEEHAGHHTEQFGHPVVTASPQHGFSEVGAHRGPAADQLRRRAGAVVHILQAVAPSRSFGSAESSIVSAV